MSVNGLASQQDVIEGGDPFTPPFYRKWKSLQGGDVVPSEVPIRVEMSVSPAMTYDEYSAVWQTVAPSYFQESVVTYMRMEPRSIVFEGVEPDLLGDVAGGSAQNAKQWYTEQWNRLIENWGHSDARVQTVTIEAAGINEAVVVGGATAGLLTGMVWLKRRQFQQEAITVGSVGGGGGQGNLTGPRTL